MNSEAAPTAGWFMSHKDAKSDQKPDPSDQTAEAPASGACESQNSTEELEYCDEELTAEEWMQFIAYCWRDELNDPRDDIYTLEDGQPEDAPR
jgi:hypothetical protein